MAQYQAGMLVLYGKLGVHEIEIVGLQSFCGKPAKITIPFALILRIPTTTAISSIICAFGLASAAPRSPYRHLELCGIALMPDWIKIAVLIGQNIGFVRLRSYYTHFKLCCWQSFFASIIGGTCNFEKHCLFFAYLTTKFI